MFASWTGLGTRPWRRSARRPDRRDPWYEAAHRHPLLPEVVADLTGRPGPNRHLDQVAATAVTVVKRALFLSQRFDLTGASVLLLGDHDLTSLALARLAPGADIAVADVDERVLEFVDVTSGGGAARRSRPFSPICGWSFRAALPPDSTWSSPIRRIPLPE